MNGVVMSKSTAIRRLVYLFFAPNLSVYILLFVLTQFCSLVIDISAYYKQHDFFARIDCSHVTLCTQPRLDLCRVGHSWGYGIRIHPSDRKHRLVKDWLFPGWRNFGKLSESPYVANPPALSEWSTVGARYTEGTGLLGRARLLVFSHCLLFGILITAFLVRSFCAYCRRHFGATLGETTVVA